MQSGHPIKKKLRANRIIAINIRTTDSLNNLVQISKSLGAFKVKQLKVLNPTTDLSSYTSLGFTQALLPTDDLAKITFNFYDSQNRSKIKDLSARALAQHAVNEKARYNTDTIIDFSQSYFKLNATPSATGWLLLQFNYEL